ncbi:MAG TPA: prenyltransferase [Burkholderiales bacterium]
MRRAGIVVSLLASLAGVGACATQAETVGTATGAAVGAAVGGGSTIGTIGGAMVGFGAGKAYDQRQNR